MQKETFNIQDAFFNNARKEKTQITIYLINGIKLLGRIKSFDKFTVILGNGPQEQMIFKHAISTISTPRTMGHHSESGGGDRPPRS
jgi:host factor-I protein